MAKTPNKQRGRDPAGQVPARRRPQDWPPEDKLKALRETEDLADSELGEYLRRQGLHDSDLLQWRQQAEAALGGRKQRNADSKRIRGLERELRRKEKALAEAAALLVLAKKARALWEDEDDDMTGGNEP